MNNNANSAQPMIGYRAHARAEGLYQSMSETVISFYFDIIIDILFYRQLIICISNILFTREVIPGRNEIVLH